MPKVNPKLVDNRIEAKSPEMVQWITANALYYIELGYDDQPELYEMAARSPEDAKKVLEVAEGVQKAVRNLREFLRANFKHDLLETDGLASLEDGRNITPWEEREKNFGDVWTKAQANFNIAANKDRNDW